MKNKFCRTCAKLAPILPWKSPIDKIRKDFACLSLASYDLRVVRVDMYSDTWDDPSSKNKLAIFSELDLLGLGRAIIVCK